MARQLYFAMASDGRKQADRDTPLALLLIDKRINITSRSFVGTEKTIEEIFDCIGEEVVDREVTRVIRRVTIEMPYSPDLGAAFIAYAKGVAASPSGSASTNKRITLTYTGATGGYVLYTLPAYDGKAAETTRPVAYPVSVPKLKDALESLDNIGYGNTVVSDLGAGVYQVEFTGKRAKAALPTLTKDVTNLTGVGADVAIAQTQAGTNYSHAITENPDYQNAYTSFVMGFEDEADSSVEIVGAIVDAVRVTIPEGNAVITLAVDIIARDIIPATGYTVPACVTPRPMRLSDCRLIHGGTDLTDTWLDGAFAFSNNTVTGNPAYTGRGAKPSRLERARRRTRTFTFRLLGGLTDSLRLEAQANPEGAVRRATSLRIGTDGENITENIPNNLLTLDNAGGGVDFQAETDSSVNRFVSNFDKVGVTAPSNTVAHTGQATAYLAPPS
jgi:hypothetical protein